MSVREVIEALYKFPMDATVSVYEGEAIGLSISDKAGNEIGFIETRVDNE